MYIGEMESMGPSLASILGMRPSTYDRLRPSTYDCLRSNSTSNLKTFYPLGPPMDGKEGCF
jgi:hypothetical protein